MGHKVQCVMTRTSGSGGGCGRDAGWVRGKWGSGLRHAQGLGEGGAHHRHVGIEAGPVADADHPLVDEHAEAVDRRAAAGAGFLDPAKPIRDYSEQEREEHPHHAAVANDGDGLTGRDPAAPKDVHGAAQGFARKRQAVQFGRQGHHRRLIGDVIFGETALGQGRDPVADRDTRYALADRILDGQGVRDALRDLLRGRRCVSRSTSNCSVNAVHSTTNVNVAISPANVLAIAQPPAAQSKAPAGTNAGERCVRPWNHASPVDWAAMMTDLALRAAPMPNIQPASAQRTSRTRSV